MHLLCQDTECAGNDLPAGGPEDEACRFCGKPLIINGNAFAVGAAPLVSGESPRSFDALMDALRDAGADVQVVDLTAVRHGGMLLVSAVTEDGELLGAEVCQGERALEVAHSLDLMDGADE